jgi:hypothetical protein
MPDLTAKRTLVKSPPELWSELSEVERLARHLGAFGEIKITKLEPEHTVAWEGESASGTVSIEPSGWGTKVTLTARVEDGAAEPQAAEEVEPEPPEEVEPEPPEEVEPEPPEEPEPEATKEPEPEPAEPSPIDASAPAPKRGFFARLLGRRKTEAIAAEPTAVEEPAAVEPAQIEEEPQPPEPEGAPVAESPPVPEEPSIESKDPQAVLDEVLDALGSAHHRPFSRG